VLFCVTFVLLNGLFVAAEFALIAAPKVTIAHGADRGDALSKRLLAILSSPRRQDRYIATSQLGITFASLGLGMYGEPLIARMLEPHFAEVPMGAGALAGALALAVLTLAHVVLGEITPKSLALQHAERVARLAYWPMRTVFLALYPFVRVLNGIARALLRALGMRRDVNETERLYTPEELQLVVEESEQGGAIRAESGRLLRELLEFGDLTAGQVMTPRVRVVGIPAGAAPDDIRATVATAPHTRYPVFDGDLDHVLGLAHVKDLLRRLIAGDPLAASHAAPMPVVPETAALDDVLATLQREQAHVAIVIDEHGGTAGLLTLEDLFQEVVGDIDEGVTQPTAVVPLSDGSLRVPGTLRLDELGQHLDSPLRHEEVDSVSGLVLALLGRPPVVGDQVAYGRLRLEVTSLRGRGVGAVRAWLVD
jgi:magnesium and cobalt exporter, CNNM family